MRAGDVARNGREPAENRLARSLAKVLYSPLDTALAATGEVTA